MRRQLMVAGLLLVAVAGCDSGRPPTGLAAATATAAVAGPGCLLTGMPSPGAGGTLGEVRGVARDAELWALQFSELPFTRGQEVKIVWRMTGSGPPQIVAAHPDGTPAQLTFGPEEHFDSSWRRPGQEWGTGFIFPRAGCWRLGLSRTIGSGEVWLAVR